MLKMVCRAMVLCAAVSVLCAFGASAYDPNLCIKCMGGMPMPNCPSPSACGYAPVDCTTCIPVKTSACKYPDYCALYNCTDCMDSMPMPNCPDPGVCGYKPTPCSGCQVGNSTAGCPHPDNCFLPNATQPATTTPMPMTTTKPSSQCVGCVDGKVSSTCPDPYVCGFAPACDDCMEGMPMPGCPDYAACQAYGLGDSCMMEMVFNTGHHVCVLLSSWNISSGAQWFGTVMAIFAAAFLREFVAFYRSYAMAMKKRSKDASKYSSVNSADLQRNLLPTTATSNTSPGAPQSSAASANSSKPSPLPFAVDSFLYLVQHTLSYLLMLVIMTYNLYLFIAVVGSFAMWHFCIHYGYARCCKGRNTQQYSASEQVKPSGKSKSLANNDIEQKTGGDHCCEDIDFDD